MAIWKVWFFCEVAVREEARLGGTIGAMMMDGGKGLCRTGDLGPVGVGAWVWVWVWVWVYGVIARDGDAVASVRTRSTPQPDGADERIHSVYTVCRCCRQWR